MSSHFGVSCRVSKKYTDVVRVCWRTSSAGLLRVTVCIESQGSFGLGSVNEVQLYFDGAPTRVGRQAAVPLKPTAGETT